MIPGDPLLQASESGNARPVAASARSRRREQLALLGRFPTQVLKSQYQCAAMRIGRGNARHVAADRLDNSVIPPAKPSADLPGISPGRVREVHPDASSSVYVA